LTGDQIKQLRRDLRCTTRELASALGLENSEIQAWESSERFPTKQLVVQMDQLRARGPSAIERKTTKRLVSEPIGLARLSDPEFWMLMQKLAAHPKLFAEAVELARAYTDPSS